jgi:hypothetical protein
MRNSATMTPSVLPARSSSRTAHWRALKEARGCAEFGEFVGHSGADWGIGAVEDWGMLPLSIAGEGLLVERAEFVGHFGADWGICGIDDWVIESLTIGGTIFLLSWFMIRSFHCLGVR